MKSLTIQLEPLQVEWLAKESRQRNQSESDIVRSLIQERVKASPMNPEESLADLCGCLEGSPDLSVRPLNGYGAAQNHR
jgi:hypothetical protein